MNIDFARTHAALDEWFAYQPRLDYMHRNAMTNGDVWEWVAAEKAAANLVREAYALDLPQNLDKLYRTMVASQNPEKAAVEDLGLPIDHIMRATKYVRQI